MGLWQNLVDSYDQNSEALKLTYPLSTTSISNNSDMIVVIVIDENGNFQKKATYDAKIEKVKRDKKSGSYIVPPVFIPIPVTERSQGRSSKGAWKHPHPIFDQYKYLKGEGKEYGAYIAQLKDFANSPFATQQICVIYKYMKKRTVASDLSGIKPKVKGNTNIIFQVEIPGNPLKRIWEDVALFNAWHQYYFSEKNSVKTLDYITGKKEPIATFHPKKISSASANAKLISGNDKANYTFRGKFIDSSEAVSIGYNASQKAHQFLRYLINDRGYGCDEQVIISFAIGSMEKLLSPPIEDKSICSMLQNNSVTTDSDIQINLRAETGFDYADALRKSFVGFGHGNALKQHVKTAVVTLDSVTDKSGRLSITFYRELNRNEYLVRVADWHSTCKWHQRFWDKENKKYVPYVSAPSVDRIIEAVYGKTRSGKDEKSYTKIKKSARERMLRCIFDGAFLPQDYVVAAIRRASNPLGITKGGEFDRNSFEQIVATACALVRKDFLQRNKGEYKLGIELERKDRDYLYGRLLGAADKLEEYVLYKQGNPRKNTAAIRYMQALSQRPYRTWHTIHGCLNPYIQKEKSSFAFDEIQSVMDSFLPGDYEKDEPLNGSFLIGYYHERAYIESLVKAAAEKKKQSTNHDEQEADNVAQ